MNFLRRYLVLLVSLLLSMYSSSVYSQSKSRTYFKEGNKAYLASSYDEASANYLRSIQEGEDSYKTNYNLGNARYRMKKYDEAIKQYEKAVNLADNTRDKADAWFNLGNSYYKKKDYTKAAEAFKNALKLNPKDEEARYNYALARKLSLSQQQQSGGNSEEKSEDKQEENKDNSSGERGEGQQQADNNHNSGNDNSENENNQQGQQQQSDNRVNITNQQGQQQQGGERGNEQLGSNGEDSGLQGIQNLQAGEEGQAAGTPQERYYESVLEAMEKQEKRAQQKIINKRIPSVQQQNGKDW